MSSKGYTPQKNVRCSSYLSLSMKLSWWDFRLQRHRGLRPTLLPKIMPCKLMCPLCSRIFQTLFYLSWLFLLKAWTTLNIMSLRSIIIAIILFNLLKIKICLPLLSHFKIQSLKDAQPGNKRKKYWQRMILIKKKGNSNNNSLIMEIYILFHRLRLRVFFLKRLCYK